MRFNVKNIVIAGMMSSTIALSSLPMAQAAEWSYEGNTGPEFGVA